MDCERSLQLLHGYLDGELDVIHSVEMESHLESCEACRALYEQQQSLRHLVEDETLHYRAPAALRERIRGELRRIDPPRRTWSGRQRQLMALAAAAVILVSVTWLRDRNGRWDTGVAMVDQVVDSHVRSLQVDHLADVPSSDRHEVKPWFNGKLDYSPTVNDFSSQGFPLIGGRLDYIDHRPVAALVYGRRKHIINVFCWPKNDKDHGNLQQLERSGFHLVHWTQGALQYWAVSDLNAVDLEQFARLVERGDTEPTED